MPKKPAKAAVTKKAQGELTARVRYHLMAADGLVGMRQEKITDLKKVRDELLVAERSFAELRNNVERKLAALGDPHWMGMFAEEDEDEEDDEDEDDD